MHGPSETSATCSHFYPVLAGNLLAISFFVPSSRGRSREKTGREEELPSSCHIWPRTRAKQRPLSCTRPPPPIESTQGRVEGGWLLTGLSCVASRPLDNHRHADNSLALCQLSSLSGKPEFPFYRWGNEPRGSDKGVGSGHSGGTGSQVSLLPVPSCFLIKELDARGVLEWDS